MPVHLSDPSVNAPQSASAAATLVLLCKRPLVGQGKQRIAATFGPEETQYLAEGFLNCALEDLGDWPGPVVLAPASDGDLAWAEQLASSQLMTVSSVTVVAQQEGNLGQRIVALDQTLLQQGHQRRVYIGSDAPALTPRHYREALNRLNRSEVVLSAADDGGVTIMATVAPWPDALIDLPWSTDRLGQALADCCRDQGLEVGYIEPSYDIDFEVDLARLQADLEFDLRPARRQLQQRLRSLLHPAANTRYCRASLSNRAEA